MNIRTVAEFRHAIHHGPYAWPGGYPCYFITNDGAALSFKAASEERRLIIQSISNGNAGWPDDGWRVVGMDINWEDAELFCEHTGERIESAYAEEEEEEANA